jgi:cyanate permease
MKNLTKGTQAKLVLFTFSLCYFTITAATFSSLGVVLPSMVSELDWDWTIAGLGFTCLGIACGPSSYLPSITIRKWGLPATLIIGLIILIAGFILLFKTQTPASYFSGCILLGIGYSFVGTVPGTYVITHFFKKHSTAFGIYYTVGGIGGIVGPITVWLATDILGSWRFHWLVMLTAITIAVSLILITFLFTDTKSLKLPPKQEKADPAKKRVYETEQVWTFKTAVRTPQYLLLLATYSSCLFVMISVNSFSVSHIKEIGISFAQASALLSAVALCNAISRIVGGFIGEYIDPKKMLLVALLLSASGMFTLSYAQSLPTIGYFSFAIGCGYGLTFLSCTVLLVRYFGTGPYLPLYSLMNVGATIASAAPLICGYLRDITGSFVPAFLIIGSIPIIIFMSIIFMRPPRLTTQQKNDQNESEAINNNILVAQSATK